MSEETQAFEPRIIAFLCNWCSYAGADLAGTSRIQYPPNVRIIRVMCSSRVNPLFILRAFRNGADGVLISGCHPGDCHYMEGNFYARRRFFAFRQMLDYVGIDPKRFQMSWVSASEGQKFGDVITGVVEEVKALGPQKELKREVVC